MVRRRRAGRLGGASASRCSSRGIGPLWHLFLNSTRAGGTRAGVIDAYWTGPYGGNSNEVFYGCLKPS